MSRIGKKPVQIPDKVKVAITGTTVSVEGPKGKVSKTFAPVVKFEQKDKTLVVSPTEETRFSRAMFGTARSVIASMVQGVSVGYAKELEIQGVGFKAAVQGKIVNMNLGFSHPINYPIPDQIKVTVEENTKLTIEGPDKQVVGLVASELRAFYPPEPYKGKGVRYVGEHVQRKEGKTVQ